MAEERDNEQTKETEATSSQQPTGQQNQQQPIAGQQGQQPSDLASQQTDERSSSQGGEGFIGSQATGSDDLLRKRSTAPTSLSQGQGAKEGHATRTSKRASGRKASSDIEGSSGRA